MDAQDFIALGIVALVAGLYLWRRERRRRSGKGACANCENARPLQRGTPLHLRRAQPDGNKKDPRAP